MDSDILETLQVETIHSVGTKAFEREFQVDLYRIRTAIRRKNPTRRED
jgi:hypothetical protein